MIAIINYGSGNVSAIANIYRQLKVPYLVADDYASLAQADRYILPGVGHFECTMTTIRQSALLAELQENVLGKQKPLLGICVGMQILADASEEGDCAGLGWIAGQVRRIPPAPGKRLPHLGWNAVSVRDNGSRLFKGVDQDKGFYFLHNYYFEPASSASVMASTDYGTDMACAVTNNKNIFGLQFHPEKSHSNGTTIFKNFCEIAPC